ncbi:hypothetical protein Pla163_36320 [Planctomycetes bacterium Pla163]|uniref:Uncharacterized protein n=1 Tax=Rohdeia mirabilis TaxID=2528008 RepID=A0A518D4S9_9BACT|nr:hypothetical protein Pla163_36320 [Planctomycetes bacterium Pla163]
MTDFDEDEDLFDFDGSGVGTGGDEDDLDIAEFLSSIDDSDASAILDLADSEDAHLASKPAVSEEALAGPEPVAALPSRSGTKQVVVAPAGPLWKQPGAMVVVGLGAVLLIANVSGFLMTWQNNTSMVQRVEAARLDMEATLARAQRDISNEVGRMGTMTQPQSPATLGVASFQSIEEHLDQGDFATARRLLYTKLSRLDRQPLDTRVEIEAHALFLLAEADRREAVVLSESAATEVGS